MYIYMCVCVCVCVYMCIYIYLSISIYNIIYVCVYRQREMHRCIDTDVDVYQPFFFYRRHWPWRR